MDADPEKKVSLSEVAFASQFGHMVPLEVTETHTSPLSPPPYMVGAAEIELDKETGEVTLTAVVYPDFSQFENTDIEDIAAAVREKVMEVNKKLPGFKQVRNVEIKKTEFEKTSSKKIKRYTVE